MLDCVTVHRKPAVRARGALKVFPSLQAEPRDCFQSSFLNRRLPHSTWSPFYIHCQFLHSL